MLLSFEDRPSDSPVVERVWSSYSQRAGEFLSIASGLWEMAVTRYRGQTFLTVRGPETVATAADCLPDAEWLGIRFRIGTFLRPFPPGLLSDRRDITLPGAVNPSFWLDGSAWEFPTFENADTFVARLTRKGLIGHDPIVSATIDGDPRLVSSRTAQRRFLRATGITYATFRTIQRARYATELLRDGLPIIDVAGQAGYFDQAHLTRSLGRLVGQSPAAIARHDRQLSYLYKTTSVDLPTIERIHGRDWPSSEAADASPP